MLPQPWSLILRKTHTTKKGNTFHSATKPSRPATGDRSHRHPPTCTRQEHSLDKLVIFKATVLISKSPTAPPNGVHEMMYSKRVLDEGTPYWTRLHISHLEAALHGAAKDACRTRQSESTSGPDQSGEQSKDPQQPHHHHQLPSCDESIPCFPGLHDFACFRAFVTLSKPAWLKACVLDYVRLQPT